MRFTATTVNAVIPPAPTSTSLMSMAMSPQLAYDTSTQKRTYIGASGSSGIIIIGETDNMHIELNQILVSWNDVAMPGQIEIRSPNADPVSLFQGLGGGQILIPGLDENLYLGRYGLRAVNNSMGGEYTVTAWYRIVEM